MEKVDWMVLAMTFITGVAAGAFIYANGFRDIDIDPVKPASVDNFEVVVSNYGGCSRGNSVCPSYRLASEGSYVYLAGNTEPVNGSIKKDELEKIAEALGAADLESMSEDKKWDSCDSWIDGIDSSYSITRGGDSYILDTCSTNIDVDDELIELLDDLFLELRKN